MKPNRAWIAALPMFCCLAFGPALAADLPDPQAVRTQLKTVAVVPLRVPADTPNREQVEQRIDKAVEDRLAAAGLTVIPATKMRELQDKVRTALGGYFDPRTGMRDEKKWEAYESHVTSEFRRQYPADAWVAPVLVRKRAGYSTAYAAWDGIRDTATGEDSAMKNIFNTPMIDGTLSAVSLRILVTTPDRQPLYARDGGIQLLEYFEKGDSMIGIDIVYVPTEESAFLADPLRIERALAIALDPLLLTKEQRESQASSQEAAWKKIALVPRSHVPPAKPAVDRAAFLARYPRVALAVSLPSEVPNRAAVRDRYAAALLAELTRAGFNVVPIEAYAAAWDPIDAASGGFYDPMTGIFLDQKHEAALRQALSQLGARSPVDAVFFATIVPKDAHLEGGNAQWDGAVVKLSNNKGGALFDRSRAFGGTLQAASLAVTAVDSSATQIYEGYGGIELLVRFKGGGLISPGGFEDVPKTDWFTDTGNDARAAANALKPLLPP